MSAWSENSTTESIENQGFLTDRTMLTTHVAKSFLQSQWCILIVLMHDALSVWCGFVTYHCTGTTCLLSKRQVCTLVHSINNGFGQPQLATLAASQCRQSGGGSLFSVHAVPPMQKKKKMSLSLLQLYSIDQA